MNKKLFALSLTTATLFISSLMNPALAATKGYFGKAATTHKSMTVHPSAVTNYNPENNLTNVFIINNLNEPIYLHEPFEQTINPHMNFNVLSNQFGHNVKIRIGNASHDFFNQNVCAHARIHVLYYGDYSRSIHAINDENNC